MPDFTSCTASAPKSPVETYLSRLEEALTAGQRRLRAIDGLAELAPITPEARLDDLLAMQAKQVRIIEELVEAWNSYDAATAEAHRLKPGADAHIVTALAATSLSAAPRVRDLGSSARPRPRLLRWSAA